MIPERQFPTAAARRAVKALWVEFGGYTPAVVDEEFELAGEAAIIDRETGLPDLLQVAAAAVQALRSYQYGNTAPELAAEVADRLKAAVDEATKDAPGQDHVSVALESTGDVVVAPPPARVWRGRTAEGVEIVALVTLVAAPSGDFAVDARMQRALETRIPSVALVNIPVPIGGLIEVVPG